MTDKIENIKKAIKHFENMRDNAVVVLDSGFGNNPGESNALYKRRKLYAELAIEALEKQLPKKPVEFQRTVRDFSTGECPHSRIQCEHMRRYNHEYEYTDYQCPVCGMLTKDGTPNYCWGCGQAIDWSDVQ